MPVKGLTLRPSREDTHTMRPVPRAAICFAMPCVSSRGPVTLTSHWWRMWVAGLSTVAPSLADGGVVDEDLHAPLQGLRAVPLDGDVELLDPQDDASLTRLSLQGLDLGVDLDGGDDVEALLGEAHRHLVPEAGTRAGDQNSLHGMSSTVEGLVTATAC